MGDIHNNYTILGYGKVTVIIIITIKKDCCYSRISQVSGLGGFTIRYLLSFICEIQITMQVIHALI